MSRKHDRSKSKLDPHPLLGLLRGQAQCVAVILPLERSQCAIVSIVLSMALWHHRTDAPTAQRVAVVTVTKPMLFYLHFIFPCLCGILFMFYGLFASLWNQNQFNGVSYVQNCVYPDAQKGVFSTFYSFYYYFFFWLGCIVRLSLIICRLYSSFPGLIELLLSLSCFNIFVFSKSFCTERAAATTVEFKGGLEHSIRSNSFKSLELTGGLVSVCMLGEGCSSEALGPVFSLLVGCLLL